MDIGNVLEEYASKRLYSSQFLEFLRKRFQDEEILCFVLIEYKGYDLERVKKALPSYEQEAILFSHQTIKAFVDGEDKRIEERGKQRRKSESHGKGYPKKMVEAFFLGEEE